MDLVEAVFEDVETAPIREELRATLVFLRKLTLTPAEVGPEDVEAVRAAGVSDAAIEDAIGVCATFNIIDRVADALGFHVPSAEGFQEAAPMMYQMGYQMPV